MSATKALAAGRHSPTVSRARNDLSSAPSDLNSSFMTSSLHRTKDRQIRRRHSPSKGGLLSRSFTKTPYIVDRAEGHCYILEDDRAIYDLSGGASVSYLGPGSNKKILAAARAQEDRVSYTASYSLTTRIAAKYADALLTTTNGVMKHAVFYSSGSDAVEAALKLSVQYFKDVTDQPTRTLFISREQSYHGTTLQALSVGGHKTRRDTFEKILTQTQHVSPCNEYRGKKDGESNEEFVSRLKEELRRKFEELGRENVAAFIAEPVVGAALGCMPSLPGYLQAMEEVCRDFGALFIVDEIMCGFGRCGKLHAWEGENVTPDIQVMGKGLAGGQREISALLVGGLAQEQFLIDALRENGTNFNHGHTFQNNPPACAAALEALGIVLELLPNVQKMGALLKKRLIAKIGHLPFVGNIRGEGLFLGIEFVLNKLTKESFNPIDAVATGIHELGLTAPHNVHIYPGAGCNGGTAGDHVIVSPAYDITEDHVNFIVEKVKTLIEDFFATFEPTPTRP